MLKDLIMKKISAATREEIKKLYREGYSRAEIVKKTNSSSNVVSSHLVYLKKGFNSYKEYNDDCAKQKGFDSYNEYRNDCLKQKGFNSYRVYQKSLREKKKEKPQNKELGRLIQERLKIVGKGASWLAGELGVTNSTVYNYLSAISFPSEDKLEKIYSILNVFPIEEKSNKSAFDLDFIDSIKGKLEKAKEYRVWLTSEIEITDKSISLLENFSSEITSLHSIEDLVK